jgi:phosphopantetheine adenylyltransferase
LTPQRRIYPLRSDSGYNTLQHLHVNSGYLKKVMSLVTIVDIGALERRIEKLEKQIRIILDSDNNLNQQVAEAMIDLQHRMRFLEEYTKAIHGQLD